MALPHIENPFLVKGYITPEYFCDREEETQKLLDAALNGRDVTMFSLRRMGKSGLLDNVGYHIRRKHKYVYIYTDIYNTETVEQLVSEIASNVVQQLFPQKGMLDKVANFFSHVKPQISFDQLSGSPQIELSFNQTSDAYTSLEEIFQLVNNHNTPVYWAWDEFQQINQYASASNVIKQLRYLVQRSTNIRFVFSGSHTNMLLSIFNQAKQPFYKSTQMIELTEIPTEQYTKFIAKQFNKGKKDISHKALERIMEYTLRHTWYTQSLCNRLYQENVSIGKEEVNQAMKRILDESEVTFYRFRQLLHKGQWELLKAIGREEKVYQPTAGKFLKKHNLGSSAAVLRALDKLLKDEFVVEIYEKEDKYYRLNDVFLMRWLQWIY